MKYILYGAGELGKLAKQFFDFYNLDYIVVDSTPDNYLHDEIWENVKIYKIDELSYREMRSCTTVVCISTFPYEKIKYKLLQNDFAIVKSFFEVAEKINKENNYKHPMTNGWTIKYFDYISFDYILKSFGTDILSTYAYKQFALWHRFYRDSDIPVNIEDRYFIPEVVNVLHDNEVFVDVGAYDGRATIQFIKKVNSKFKHIFCFEPDNYNYSLLESNLPFSMSIVKSNLALGNRNGFVKFSPNFGYLSKINKKSKDKKKIIKLDSLKFIKPTFIKYHIEGGEYNALKGSIKTLKKYRPIIAVTTYHNKDGLYKIPIFLINKLKDYKFYWRNHNYMGTGAVLYCIPIERNK